MQAPRIQQLAALLLALAWGAVAQQQRSETYQAPFISADGPGVSVLASGVKLEGEVLSQVASSSPAGCATACHDSEECIYFNWSDCRSVQVRHRWGESWGFSGGPSPVLSPNRAITAG